ncbi:hypothetical protein CBL_09297 [Carabus blaptoides fortunei]
MCQSKQSEVPAVKSPKSPWRRLFRQPVRPKLSRKVVTGARVNLNLYWSKFEEVTSFNRPSNVLLYASPSEQVVTSSDVTIAHDDNAINDNLANERTESGNKTNIANF